MSWKHPGCFPSRFVDLLNLWNFFIELILNLTNQFFQNILKGYHPKSSAKLVNHDGEVELAIEEKFEKFFKSACFWNKNNFPGNRNKI